MIAPHSQIMPTFLDACSFTEKPWNLVFAVDVLVIKVDGKGVAKAHKKKKKKKKNCRIAAARATTTPTTAATRAVDIYIYIHIIHPSNVVSGWLVFVSI